MTSAMVTHPNGTAHSLEGFRLAATGVRSTQASCIPRELIHAAFAVFSPLSKEEDCSRGRYLRPAVAVLGSRSL